MANAGFSAPVNYWGTISGLTPKSSSDGKTSQLAEAQDEYGDTAAHDVYGEVLAPSTEYAVTGEVDLSDIVLGSIHTYGTGNDTKKLMLKQVQINTRAGNPPTVLISGVEVESGATAQRTYAISGTLTPRCKAQDVASALTAHSGYTQINTTFSVDSAVETVAGTPVASGAYHGRVEVSATLTDTAGTATITAAGGFTVTTVAAQSNPDAGYVTRTATLTKFIGGTETETSS